MSPRMEIPLALAFVAAALVLTAVACYNVTANVSLSVPGSQPPFAKPVDPAFVSFSLEFQYWPVYAGNGTLDSNCYLNQLLSNLAERTGKPPAIRVGGE